MVRSAVREHFRGGALERHVTDYLDKLIQVPIRVPRLGEQETRAYMFLLFTAKYLSEEAMVPVRAYVEDRLRASWRDEPFSLDDYVAQLDSPEKALLTDLEVADRIAPLLAKASKVDGNPRTIKRLLNSLRMRSMIARQRSIPLDDAVLAKLAIFERCTDQAACSALFRSVTDASDGRSALLRLLESNKFDPDSLPPEFPESWKKDHIDFLVSWASLEPTLAEMDLRGAVYLSRELAVLRSSRTGLSAAAADVFKLLVRLPNANLPAATREAKKLNPEEAKAVMGLLIAEMRKVTDWATKPAACNGAITLRTAVPSTAPPLNEFLESLTTKPLWLQPLLAKKPVAEG